MQGLGLANLPQQKPLPPKSKPLVGFSAYPALFSHLSSHKRGGGVLLSYRSFSDK